MVTVSSTIPVGARMVILFHLPFDGAVDDHFDGTGNFGKAQLTILYPEILGSTERLIGLLVLEFRESGAFCKEVSVSHIEVT